ncbi:DUF397 domain-containing protein [Streptomyces kronopolitis]|uniref:DUF397 domain-containing protein n=1 Tax=Streptomyces kronopolitis TaxID=1612435 RepID=UPI003446DD3D
MTEHAIPNAASLRGWRKSSYSDNEGASCLEVLDNYPCGVPVRDSKVPHGPALVFETAAWSSFVGAVKDGALPGRR